MTILQTTLKPNAARLFMIALATLIALAQLLPRSEAAGIELDVRKQTLGNGMRILVLENHSAPVLSTVIRYNVGSVDERPGITGTSHLLEHMRFKGTKVIGTSDYDAEAPILAQIDSVAHLMRAEQVKLQSNFNPPDSARYKELRQQIAALQAQQKRFIIKDELWDTYLQNGATGLNASTSEDATQYIVSLPSNRLELWAFLESDRMANPVLREFYSERDVVMEERRMSVENSPRGILYEASSAAAFWASGYRWPVVGWMSDLHTVLREDVEAYYHTYYSPSNAVAVIVGDVKPDEVFALCEKYFGPISVTPLPPEVVTMDAPQRGERRIEVEYDANPSAMIQWPMPSIGHPDIPALDVAASILSAGRTSRFFKNIRQKRLGQASASAGTMTRYPNTFSCDIQPFGDHTLSEVESAVYAEIERLKTEPVTEPELERVRNQSDAAFVRSLESNRGMTYRLANSEILTGDWHYFANYQETVKKVSADDIMRVVNKYLVKSARTVVTVVKPSIAEKSSTAAQAQ